MGKKTKRLIDYIRNKELGAESIRYIIVGVTTTLLNYGLFELMQTVIGISVTVSNVTSICVAIVFSYVANKLYVFKRHSDSQATLALEFIKFVGSRLITMAIEVGIVELFDKVLGYDARIGKVVALVLVIIVNYILSKMIVFKKLDKTDDS